MIENYSLVIPTYRGAARLQKLFESLSASRFLWNEIVVVDDGSPAADRDEIRRVVDEMSGLYVKHVALSHNSGCVAAQRAGVAQSRGDVIFLMDDDILVPAGLRQSAERLFALKNVGVLSWKSAPYDAVNLTGREGFVQPATQLASYCMAFRRSLWDELGGLDARFRMYCGDSDFALRAAMAGHPSYRVFWPLVPHAEHAAFKASPELENRGAQASRDLTWFRNKWNASGEEMERRALADLEVCDAYR